MNSSPGKFISATAALVVLLFFFLPWVTVSCSGEEITDLSGYELAAGTEVDLGVGTEEVDPDPLVFAVPGAAVVVIALVLVSVFDLVPSNLAAAGQVAAASIGLLTMAYKWLDARNDTAGLDFVSYSIEIGVWGVVIGFLAIIIGGTLDRFQEAGILTGGSDKTPP